MSDLILILIILEIHVVFVILAENPILAKKPLQKTDLSQFLIIFYLSLLHQIQMKFVIVKFAQKLDNLAKW